MRKLIIASIVAAGAALSFAAPSQAGGYYGGGYNNGYYGGQPTTATSATTTRAITSPIAGSRRSASMTITAIWSSSASGSATDPASPDEQPLTKPAGIPPVFSLWLGKTSRALAETLRNEKQETLQRFHAVGLH